MDAIIPQLAEDTFVTIDRRLDDCTDLAQLTVLWPGFQVNALVLPSHAWFIVPNTPLAFAGEDLHMLAGKFTVGEQYSVSGEGIIVTEYGPESGDSYVLGTARRIVARYRSRSCPAVR